MLLRGIITIRKKQEKITTWHPYGTQKTKSLRKGSSRIFKDILEERGQVAFLKIF